ncbi:MAG: amino acid ABC transporter permease [Gammaproteobacteria bacterium]|nr:amino acid ABC transporter permease [Gammaproteobacteria bacterium]
MRPLPPMDTMPRRALHWSRYNLFSSPANTLLTITGVLVLYWTVPGLMHWLWWDAVFDAAHRNECRAAGSGACWAVVRVRLDQLLYGFYPVDQRWRVNLAFVLLLAALVPVLRRHVPGRRYWIAGSVLYPLAAYWLLWGGMGLAPVDSSRFGGFMLTVLIGVTGIVSSLPLGILLALGRRSQYPVLRLACIAFIEFVRGVPLITLLFVGSTLLNYFFPPGTAFDLLFRVFIIVALFAAAYLAEVIRGGLAAIPRGQYEAAAASGLGYAQTMGLIVLPQALRISIPGIVNIFIGLYKDTTLVLIIGLLDPLGISQSILADSKWQGLSTELYIFIALGFFVTCFAMSKYSQHLERRLSPAGSGADPG